MIASAIRPSWTRQLAPVHQCRGHLATDRWLGVGYLVKDTPPGDIVRAVRSVAAGRGVLSPEVTRPLLDLLQQSGPPSPLGPPSQEHAPGRLDALTERERDVAVAIAEGASNAEIAARLYVSTATVKAAVSRILTKLDLANRTQIAVIVHNQNSS